MRRRPIAIAVAVGALATAGTAVAAGGGPDGILGDRDERQAELAQDLAAQLDGVNANQVERALDAVHEQHRAEHRQEMAEGIASHLDGVSAEQVSAALESFEQQVEQSRESGERPDEGALVSHLASELGVSEEQVQQALDAAHEEHAEARRAEAEQRLDEAVQEGRITQEEADQIRERLESGPPEGRGPGGPGGPDGLFGGPEGGPGGGAGGPSGDAQGSGTSA